MSSLSCIIIISIIIINVIIIIKIVIFIMSMLELSTFRVKNHHLLTREESSGLVETENHKCTLVHHGNPYTKLGPFKIERVYNSPTFIIIHELLTEEDMSYLVSWARPRLSR